MAKTCAVCSYSPAFASSPLARDWSARVSACRAEACSRSTSDICRDSFISSWRWLPITAAACRDSPSCWRWASSIACWIWILGSACSSTCAPNQDMKYFQAFTNGLAMVRGSSCPAAHPTVRRCRCPSCQVAGGCADARSAVEHPPGDLLGLRQPGPQPVQVAAERRPAGPPSCPRRPDADIASTSAVRATSPSSAKTVACIRASRVSRASASRPATASCSVTLSSDRCRSARSRSLPAAATAAVSRCRSALQPGRRDPLQRVLDRGHLAGEAGAACRPPRRRRRRTGAELAAGDRVVRARRPARPAPGRPAAARTSHCSAGLPRRGGRSGRCVATAGSSSARSAGGRACRRRP